MQDIHVPYVSLLSVAKHFLEETVCIQIVLNHPVKCFNCVCVCVSLSPEWVLHLVWHNSNVCPEVCVSVWTSLVWFVLLSHPHTGQTLLEHTLLLLSVSPSPSLFPLLTCI